MINSQTFEAWLQVPVAARLGPVLQPLSLNKYGLSIVMSRSQESLGQHWALFSAPLPAPPAASPAASEVVEVVSSSL